MRGQVPPQLHSSHAAPASRRAAAGHPYVSCTIGDNRRTQTFSLPCITPTTLHRRPDRVLQDRRHAAGQHGDDGGTHTCPDHVSGPLRLFCSVLHTVRPCNDRDGCTCCSQCCLTCRAVPRECRAIRWLAGLQVLDVLSFPTPSMVPSLDCACHAACLALQGAGE